MYSKSLSFSLSLLFTVFVFISCGTAEKSSVSDGDTSILQDEIKILEEITPDFDPEVNVVYFRGWKIPAAPECRFSSQIKGVKNGSLLKISFNNEPLLSLTEIDFGFNVNNNLLIKHVEKEISSSAEIISGGTIDLTGSSGKAREGYFWVYSGKTVLLEKAGDKYYEWRINSPLDPSLPESRASLKSIREAEHVSENISCRIQEKGFLFTSHNSPWKWKSDLGDGFLLDCLVPDNSPKLIAAVFSSDSIDKSDNWIKSVSDSPEKKNYVKFTLNGELIESEIIMHVVKDSFGRKEYVRLVLSVGKNNLHKEIFIVFYSEIIDGVKTDPVEIFNSDQVQHLLNYDIALPVEAAL